MKMGFKLAVSMIIVILLVPSAFSINGEDTSIIGGKVPVELLKTIKEEATEHYLGKDGIVGIGYTRDPPRIVFMVESEDDINKVPDRIDGVETKVIVTGKIEPAVCDLSTIRKVLESRGALENWPRLK
ncbi:MAG: hypothetical protein DRN13_00050, partial [Thermoplasmata archaeon]